MPACKQCRQDFPVAQDDLVFYDNMSPVIAGKKYGLPPPALCPLCRLQLRLSFRNLRNLSHRVCDRTGKAIVSCYRASSPHTVYHSQEWWGDGWDALQYGRDFDPSRPFFDQFFDLYRAVPVVNQYATKDLENSEYINGASHCKNCYLSFMMDFCEDCYYISYAERDRSCIDCLGIVGCELCYECVDCRDCYQLLFGQRCIHCTDSIFLSDCLRCKHCIGCTNLVDKEYHIFNKPCLPEEYERQKKTLLGGDRLPESLERFRAWSRSAPKKYYFGSNNEQFSGDSITHVKNSYHCFDVNHLENCKYCTYVFHADNCMDYHVYGNHSSWIYNCAATGTNCTHNAFCLCCWSGSSFNLYCHLINASSHCFGCSGLKNKKYCVLNKQYTQAEYEQIVPVIIEHMRKAGEWGEFFPAAISPFGYNESEAQEYFPLAKADAHEGGWRWQEEESSKDQYLGPVVEIPTSIAATSDDICSNILLCETTGKAYKIIPQELQFYRLMGIPVPRKCPDQRHKERVALRNPRKLWSRECAKCKTSIETTYAPERQETIYCENCYLSTLY